MNSFWILILVILICPLMHFWMMKKGGHGHGNHKKEKKQKKGGEK